MSDRPHPLSFAARQAVKEAERRQIADQLRAETAPAEQIAREHQPWADLVRSAEVRYDLANRLV